MEPFADLVALVRPAPGMRILDLGCGTGELTAILAERFSGSRVDGIDSSPAMLGRAASRATERITFGLKDISEVDEYGAYQVIFSNAALHWVPDNERLMEKILGRLKPG